MKKSSPKLTRNQALAKALEECGSVEMPVEEALIVAGCSRALWDKFASLRDAYRKGQLTTKLAVRTAVVEMAKQADPKAVRLYLDFTNAIDRHDVEPVGGVDIVL